jgi:hypothetical protein
MCIKDLDEKGCDLSGEGYFRCGICLQCWDDQLGEGHFCCVGLACR